jgi:hypothetical protein
MKRKSCSIVLSSLFLLVINFKTVSQPDGSSPLQPYSIDWRTGDQTDLNLSYLLEKPAGKSGYIQIKDGHFYTADGKRLRIWGVNMTGGACYPEKEDAPKIAAFLARYGINGVRFHFLDSEWGPEKSIFDYTLESRRKLNPEQLDKLDFFIFELKKQGIYTNLNLNVGRHYKAEDEVPEYEYLGLAKAATLFDDRLIKLQKEYARQLLTHRNPYTGNRYVDEPALIIVEIVNENSLVEAWFGDRLSGKNATKNTSTWSGIPPYYARELTEKYNKWLSENISEQDIDRIAEEAERDPDGLIPRLESDEFSDASKLRFGTEASFIMDMERKFYSGMHHFLKSTLGLKALVIGNSDHNHYKSGYALLSSLSKLDAVDGHVYWQHPNYTKDPDSGETIIKFNYTPMVHEPEISTVVQLSRSAVAGKPYTVSETNHPFPSAFACEGIPILAAYALFQDWDGVFYYTLEHGDPRDWNTKTPNPFDIYSDPVKMSNMAAGSLMFHRGDVTPADSTIMRDYNHYEIVEGIRSNIGEMPYFTPGFNSVLPLIYGTRIRGFFREHEYYPTLKTPNPIVSQTGELSWYHDASKSFVCIDTEHTQAQVGFINDCGMDLPHLRVDITNGFASVILSSTGTKTISEADELLLVTTAKFELSNMKYSTDHTFLEQWGNMPGKIEPVTGIILLKGLKNVYSAELIPIGGNGNAIGSTIVTPDTSGYIHLPVGTPPTPLYLLRINR